MTLPPIIKITRTTFKQKDTVQTYFNQNTLISIMYTVWFLLWREKNHYTEAKSMKLHKRSNHHFSCLVFYFVDFLYLLLDWKISINQIQTSSVFWEIKIKKNGNYILWAVLAKYLCNTSPLKIETQPQK